jgi:ABC-type uncharacterized transport system substrate-binding protein
MRPRFPLTLLAVLCFATTSIASTIVVIQGNTSPFGRKYFSGFSSLATDRVSAFLYDGKKEKPLLAQVQKLAPDLVVTIGEVPLSQLVMLLPATPFIVGDYYPSNLAKRANIVMMESELPVGSGLALFQALFPNRKTIGTIYDPKYSQGAVDSLVAYAGKLGLKVASIKVDSPNDVASYIQAFAGKVDLLYCMRDATTSNEGATKQIFAFSEQNNIPVISLDPDHIARGALMTVAVDPLELGEQAWGVARVILKEGKIPQLPVSVDPHEMTASISMKGLARFGVGADALFGFLQKGVKDGYSVRIEP